MLYLFDIISRVFHVRFVPIILQYFLYGHQQRIDLHKVCQQAMAFKHHHSMLEGLTADD